MNNDRDALLVRCSKQESKLIRETAKLERRTLSGFVLRAVLNHIESRQHVQKELQERLLPRHSRRL